MDVHKDAMKIPAFATLVFAAISLIAPAQTIPNHAIDSLGNTTRIRKFKVSLEQTKWTENLTQ